MSTSLQLENLHAGPSKASTSIDQEQCWLINHAGGALNKNGGGRKRKGEKRKREKETETEKNAV